MIPVHGKILVSCNMKQKAVMQIGYMILKTANAYAINYRERSPVIAVVEQGNETVKPGDVLLCHHNTFYTPSPYFLQDNQFSIPFSAILFAKVLSDGDLEPLCGNILCDRPDIETTIPLPPEMRKKHIDRVIVKDGRGTKYRKGQLLFTRPHSYYEIVYMYNNVETRIHKCHESMVCGVLK